MGIIGAKKLKNNYFIREITKDTSFLQGKYLLYNGAQKKIKMTWFMKSMTYFWPGVLHFKMPPCSGPLGSTLPLTGALKWGTVWTSTSTRTGIIKGQSWTFVFY